MINSIYPLPASSITLTPATTPDFVSKGAAGATVWLPAIIVIYSLGY